MVTNHVHIGIFKCSSTEEILWFCCSFVVYYKMRTSYARFSFENSKYYVL